MPPMLPSFSTSAQPSHGMPEPGSSALPLGASAAVNMAAGIAVIQRATCRASWTEGDCSDQESTDSMVTTPRSEEAGETGDTRMSVTGLIHNEDLMACKTTTGSQWDSIDRMVDFVAVLEENSILHRASRTSGSEKQQKKAFALDARSRSSIGDPHDFKSAVPHAQQSQRQIDEKELILKLFNNDSGINSFAGEKVVHTLMPQHRSLGRVVKHIFCQVDVDKVETTDSGRQATLQALISRNAARLVKNQVFSGFFMLLTVYMLFAPDLILLWGNRELDDDFLMVNTIIFFLFLSELMLFILGQRRQYIFSANIVMDVLSLLSIMLDSLLMTDDMGGGATVMRMARSSRMTRLARMARVARVTRLIPSLLRLCRKDRMQLAKIVLLRRLWRTFCFLDTDSDCCVNTFDARFLYLTIMGECGNVMKMVPDRLQLLSADVRWLLNQKAIKERQTLGFEDFIKIMLGTGLGKKMEEHHREDVAADRGVLSLTQALGDSTAMKVCIGIIILIGMLSVFEVERLDTSAEQGLAQLDGIARAMHGRKLVSENFLCNQIFEYTGKHKVDYIFLDGYTYWLHGHCLMKGIPESEFDPLAHVEDIIENSALRRSEFIKACWQGCTSEMSSVALVDNSERDRTNALSGFIQTAVVIFLLILFVYILNMGITRFSKTMLEPLRAISDDMTALACMDLVHIDKEMPDSEKGDRAVKVAEELRQLQMSFHSMKHAVKSWSKYVPPSVVQRLFAAGVEAKIGVVRCNASIFFCDIVGFEDICCGLAPRQILDLLSTVLEMVAEIIHKNEGTLLEFIGDEVLAVFNTPNKTKHHAFQAVRSAYEVHATVQNLPPAQKQDGTETKIRLRCGVNTSNLLAGNLGSSQRMKYGVLGDGVNLTARLKGLNSRYNSHTLISDHTLHDPLCRRKFITRPVDLVAVKGKTEPTRVHELLQPMHHGDSRWMKESATMHSEAYSLYLSRQFEEAKAIFEEVLAAFKEHGLDDGPSRLLRSRCIAHMKDPPPEDWDGVERLTKKTFEGGFSNVSKWRSWLQNALKTKHSYK